MEIIPAILPKDFADLEARIAQVKGLVSLVQVDICDGKLTPAASWPYKKRDENFEAMRTQGEGLPFWKELDYEFDLMINLDRPEDFENWMLVGGSRIVLHAESKGDIEQAVFLLKDQVEIGLALDIETSLDAIEPFKEKIQYIQLMGIDNVGFQGQAFDEKVLKKVKAAKAKYLDLPVQIDGGVNLEKAKLLEEAGADRLVIGSAIFESDNVVEMIKKFKDI